MIKTSLRHLWKNKLFTLLNILGLSIGISACWLVFSIVYYEYSYDQKIPQLEHVYQIYSGDSVDPEDQFAGVPLGMPPLLAGESLDDALIVPVYNQYVERFFIPQQNGEELVLDEQGGIISTLPSYFDLLPFEWLAGNPTVAFADPHHIVLTERRAALYFPTEDPSTLIGRSIRADTVTYLISGIVKNLDFPSSFQDEVFLPISEKEWHDHSWHSMNSNHTLYVRTTNPTSLNHLLGLAQQRYDEVAAKDHAQYGSTIVFGTAPLAEKHFSPSLDTRGLATEKSTLYGLMAIGGFLLLLACINYINLSTAQVPQRAKEIGIRKTLGAHPGYLTINFLTETACIALFALILSWPLTRLFNQIYPEFVPQGMDFFDHSYILVLFLIALILLISILAGLYPSYLINKVQAIDTLKGKIETRIKGTRLTLRKGLIVFQFIIAQLFIVSALIMGQQLNYTLRKDLGFQHEAIITIGMPYKTYQNADVDPFLYKRALEKYPEVAGVALGHEPQSNNHWGSAYYFSADTGQVQLLTPRKYIDADFIALYGMELLAGRNIRQTDTLNELLINEAVLKSMGWKHPEEAIGKFLAPGPTSEKQYPIVGVVRDFHQKSLRSEIGPLVMGASKERSNLQTFHIKLPDDRQNWQNTLSILQTEWKNYYPDAPFVYQFVDEKIKNLYLTEYKRARLIGLATGITIFISCLGLFGLVTLTAFQRIKEIGIRKVLGASVAGIVSLLSKDFIKLVCLAIVIASPIAWWAMHQWLQDFAYRIEIQWWIFALAGLVAVAIALLTVSYQAIRAAWANPVESLRDE